MTAPLAWSFLDQTFSLEDIGWQGNKVSKLWRYNQHYFDDLNSKDSINRKNWHSNLIKLWIEQNPPMKGVGWEPYPTSLRIVNWIKWSLSGNSLSLNALKSLALQARWLNERVEWHLLGNHLFTNAKALVFAGLFFNGDEANKWLEKGMNILSAQLKEQILNDGAHFELSPMYHALITEDMLDLINITQNNNSGLSIAHTNITESWPKVVSKMLSWLETISHPDKKISFFNDACFAISPEINDLFEYASMLNISETNNVLTKSFNQTSGLIGVQIKNSKLIVDLAEIEAKYIPGHSHAGTLSFEFSHSKERIFVNSGISDYSVSDERLRQRGTSSHNTVCVEKQNSSEIWSSFRVGARARVKNRIFKNSNDFIFLEATHDGYGKLFDGLLHTRQFILRENSLIISDIISKSGPLCEARFHLHPNIKINMTNNHSGTLQLRCGEIMNWSFCNLSSCEIQKTTWHPQFGKSIPNMCLVGKFEDKCDFKISWN